MIWTCGQSDHKTKSGRQHACSRTSVQVSSLLRETPDAVAICCARDHKDAVIHVLFMNERMDGSCRQTSIRRCAGDFGIDLIHDRHVGHRHGSAGECVEGVGGCPLFYEKQWISVQFNAYERDLVVLTTLLSTLHNQKN